MPRLIESPPLSAGDARRLAQSTMQLNQRLLADTLDTIAQAARDGRYGVTVSLDIEAVDYVTSQLIAAPLSYDVLACTELYAKSYVKHFRISWAAPTEKL